MKYFILILSLVVLSGCEEVDKEAHDSEGNALEETITRKEQRVVRYKCNGQVKSDKVETVNSVSKQFTLNPKRSTDLYNFTATNETTKSSKGSIWLGKGVFTLDLAPTVFNIKADEGMNKIVWKFSYCKDLDTQNHTCRRTPEIKESGTTFIHIRQEKVFLDGVKEIRPTAQECKS